MIADDPWVSRRQRVWPSDRWGDLTCQTMWDETPNTRTFLLAPSEGAHISHIPGQYMTFRVHTPSGTLERCYTISSSAARNGGIEVTVKRQANGAVSPIIHDTWMPGSRVEAFGPSGRFTPESIIAGKFAFIAAGTGVTPIMSILRTAADRGIALDAVFLHVARTTEHAIAAEDLPSLHRRLPNLMSDVLLSSGPQAARLVPTLITRMIPDLADRHVLCCGPGAFMAMVEDTALRAGVPASQYLQENFTFTDPAETDEVARDAPLRRVVFAKSGHTFDCPDGMNILKAAKVAGVPMPSSCSRGECGTCKTFKHSGEVNMINAGGLRQREMDRGFILPCTSRPLTDIVLDR